MKNEIPDINNIYRLGTEKHTSLKNALLKGKGNIFSWFEYSFKLKILFFHKTVDRTCYLYIESHIKSLRLKKAPLRLDLTPKRIKITLE